MHEVVTLKSSTRYEENPFRTKEHYLFFILLLFWTWERLRDKSQIPNFVQVNTELTLFKTDSTRAGCLACQNRNPRTTRWKISFTGFRTVVWKVDSSGSMVSSIGFPNCPAEFSNATPMTCSGNASAVNKAVNPPRLKILTFCHMAISSSSLNVLAIMSFN